MQNRRRIFLVEQLIRESEDEDFYAPVEARETHQEAIEVARQEEELKRGKHRVTPIWLTSN